MRADGERVSPVFASKFKTVAHRYVPDVSVEKQGGQSVWRRMTKGKKGHKKSEV